MSKRYTTETFKNLILELYGSLYGVEDVQYVSSASFITLKCHKHGNFTKRANEIQQGKGHCPTCVKERLLEQKRIEGCKSFVHRTKLATPHVLVIGNYVSLTERLLAYCTKHSNVYAALPASLLTGIGCPLCTAEKASKSLRNTQEWFIEKSLTKSDEYDYSEAVYTKANENVKIRCKKCENYFFQTPSNHLKEKGTGCPNCMSCGFNPAKSGWLYVFRMGEYVKIGITNRSKDIRAKELSKSSGKDCVEIYSVNFDRGSEAKEMESKALNWLRQRYASPTEKFDGSTETFIDVDIEELLIF